MKQSAPSEKVICLVTGLTAETGNLEEMLRFVISPDGELVPDLAGKLPGISFWVRGKKEYVRKAIDEGIFTKAAAQAVTVKPDLADRLEVLLVDQLLGQLGLTRRSGALLAGFAKVEAALRKGEARLIVAAGDAAEDGRNKIAALAQQHKVPVMAEMSVSALSSALGLENAVHLAVTDSGWAKTIVKKAQRLALYRHGVLGLYSEDITSALTADGETDKDE